MSFEQECLELFGTSDLYLILHIDKGNLTSAKVKKAYYNQSLLWHPDRFSSSNDEASITLVTRKFQAIGRIYNILSDNEKRHVYDTTGTVDDDLMSTDNADWMAVFRTMFKKVTKEDIEAFYDKYRGSKEEEDALKEAYVRFKGNMDKIMCYVISSDSIEDEERFHGMINGFIEKGEVEAYKAFTNENPQKKIKRHKKSERERKEAEKELAKMSQGDRKENLAEMVLANRQKHAKGFEEMIARLEAKHSKSGKSKAGTSKTSAEPTSIQATSRKRKK